VSIETTINTDLNVLVRHASFKSPLRKADEPVLQGLVEQYRKRLQQGHPPLQPPMKT
jgi:hypothetical protein